MSLRWQQSVSCLTWPQKQVPRSHSGTSPCRRVAFMRSGVEICINAFTLLQRRWVAVSLLPSDERHLKEPLFPICVFSFNRFTFYRSLYPHDSGSSRAAEMQLLEKKNIVVREHRESLICLSYKWVCLCISMKNSFKRLFCVHLFTGI